MSYTAEPQRMLTEEEIRQYQEDAIVMLEQAVEPNWMAMVEASFEEARNNSSLLGNFMSPKVGGYQIKATSPDWDMEPARILPFPDPQERAARRYPQSLEPKTLVSSGLIMPPQRRELS